MGGHKYELMGGPKGRAYGWPKDEFMGRSGGRLENLRGRANPSCLVGPKMKPVAQPF